MMSDRVTEGTTLYTPITLCEICRVHQTLHVSKDKAAEEAVAIATGSPD